MPLQRYGTGFLKGLTQVAQQAKSDLRAQEDADAKNNLAMAQLAVQSGDPTLIQGALDRLTEGFGGAKPKGAKKGAGAKGGAADPQSMIAQLLIGGLDRDEGEGGQAPLRIQTAEEKTQARIAEQQQLDEAKIAQLRRAGASPEQITLIMQQLAGAPAGPTGFAPQGSVPFTAGVPGEQIPPRPPTPPAPVNAQRMTGNLASDSPDAPEREFIFDPRTRQFTEQDGTPVTEPIEQRRTPPQERVQRFQPRTVRVGASDEVVQANYDSQTGQYFDPNTGDRLQDVRPAPTAEQRNKAAARKLVVPAIDEIRTLSESVIQHVGPRQRAEALRRGAAAVLGNDPEWRTYRDARRALAGNLAVLQQGSRPSDADISAVWLPLVPDVFTDTTESAAMKWRLIRVMSGLEVPAAGAGPAAGAAPTNPFR